MSTQSGHAERKPRILVVEDDDSVRRSTQLILRGRGLDVLAYPTGERLLLEKDIDHTACLVADYRLGDHNGISLLSALRARGWPGPAILMTGYPSHNLRLSAEVAGFDLFLEKPLREYALINGIARLIERDFGMTI